MSNEKEMNAKQKKSDIFVKGLNWGNLKTTENELIFSHKSKVWFNMPTNSISNIQHISNKNEIALEINQEDANDDTALCELRLFVPEQETKNKKKEGRCFAVSMLCYNFAGANMVVWAPWGLIKRERGVNPLLSRSCESPSIRSKHQQVTEIFGKTFAARR